MSALSTTSDMSPELNGVPSEMSSMLVGFENYELHGWHPDSSLSFDENLMDLVMLVTRSSTCRQGSMACILVQQTDNGDQSATALHTSIISVAINQSLFKAKNSDVHAEIAALGAACRSGSKTNGCSAYITMPPCKNCFGALVTAGVKRIVTRVPCLQPVLGAAEEHGIELVVVGNNEARMARINTLIHGNPEGKKRQAILEEDRDVKRQK